MLKFFRPQTCPYCFSKFMMASAPARCINPQCTLEVDPVLDKVWNDSRPKGKVFKIGVCRKRGKCPECEDVTSQRICPDCHMELPPSFGSGKNLILAVIGARASGKSHFITAFYERIRQEIGPDMHILLSPSDDRTWVRYRDKFYTPMFEDGRIIDPTPPVAVDQGNRLPLVFGLTFTSGKKGGRGRKITKHVTLSFFDTPGEDLLQQNVMESMLRYIGHADGLVLLIDPLQLGKVRDLLPSGTPMPDRDDLVSSSILTRTINIIREKQRVSDNKKIKTPLAVSFTKFDAIDPILPGQMQIAFRPDRSTGAYDKVDMEAVDAEMQSLLREWGCNDLWQMVYTHFSKFAFFGLSSLGCNPHGDSRIPAVNSRRVEDPFLWLLYVHKLIKEMK